MKYRYILACIPFVLFSCSNENDSIIERNAIVKKINLSTEEYLSIAYSNVTEFSELQLLEILGDSEFINKVNTRSTNVFQFEYYNVDKELNRYNEVSTRNQESLSTIKVVEISTQIDGRIVNYILSADPTCPKLLAYTQRSTTDSIKKDNYAVDELLKIGIETVFAEKKEIKCFEDSLRQKTINKICDEFGIVNYSFEEVKDRIIIENRSQLTRSPIIRERPEGIASGVGPVLVTKWNSGAPYARELGSYFFNHQWTVYYTAGEFATAIAQVLAYCEPTMNCSGVTMDWNWLTSKPEIYGDFGEGLVVIGRGTSIEDPIALRTMVGYLYKDIVANTDNYLDHEYFNGGDFAFAYEIVYGRYVKPASMQTYLSKYLNLTSRKKWDYNSIISSLNQYRPVIVYVESTIQRNANATTIYAMNPMVIDGYANCNPGIYLHVNECKSRDGWYYVSSTSWMSLENQSYTMDSRNNNLWIIPDLRKK